MAAGDYDWYYCRSVTTTWPTPQGPRKLRPPVMPEGWKPGDPLTDDWQEHKWQNRPLRSDQQRLRILRGEPCVIEPPYQAPTPYPLTASFGRWLSNLFARWAKRTFGWRSAL